MAYSSYENISKAPVFPKRIDHIYCVSVGGSDTNPAMVYIGQSVSPGRALKHFRSHNNKLQQRLAGESPWQISFQGLNSASVEDLCILECLAIDVVMDDYRFSSANGSRGATVFHPKRFYPTTNIDVANAIYVLWERSKHGYKVLFVTDEAPTCDPDQSKDEQFWMVTPPLTQSENVATVLEAIRSLITSCKHGEIPHLANPYFQYLEDIGLQKSPKLPAAGKSVTLTDLFEDLAGSFMYVQINDKCFDDFEIARPGIEPGLQYSALTDRIEKYWDKRSTSNTPGRTLGSLANPAIRKFLQEAEKPKYIVGAISGTKIVLAIWKLDEDSERSWFQEDKGKVVFPLAGLASQPLLEKYTGAKIASDLELYSKAVKWIDVIPNERNLTLN